MKIKTLFDVRQYGDHEVLYEDESITIYADGVFYHKVAQEYGTIGRKEMEVIEYLLDGPKTSSQLLDLIWNSVGDKKLVHVTVSHLRTKLGKSYFPSAVKTRTYRFGGGEDG